MQPEGTENVKGRKRSLGRGLSALFDDSESDLGEATGAPSGRDLRSVGIDLLSPGRFQPRHTVEPETLDELASSIAAHGVLQPVIVRRLDGPAEAYEIIAGERRWRAAQKAQLHQIPVIIKDFDDTVALQVALIENLQRENLNAVEEALGYRRLMDEFGHSQEKLAAAMGKSRSHVANTLRLLNLPDVVLSAVKAGKLSAGHARAMVTAADPEELMRRVIAGNLSVRETEKLAAERQTQAAPRVKPEKDIDTLALEAEVSAALGMKVAIDMQGKGGSLKVAFKNLEQLDEILRLMSQSKSRIAV